MKSIYIFLICITFNSTAFAQSKWNLIGTIFNLEQQPMRGATVTIQGTAIATSSNKKGVFFLNVPTNKNITLQITHIGYLPHQQQLFITKNQPHLHIVLRPKKEDIKEVVVSGKNNIRQKNTIIPIKKLEHIPTAAGGSVEQLIKTLPGVTSNNELSNKYAVRGGNFDENLVYINEIEMYRPKLIRSGQQEGLSIINPDMVQNIQFSAGGFDAHYGDKMASVLDIKYQQPKAFSAKANISLLNNSVFVANRHQRFSYALGIRNKSNQYLLKTLDTKGDYHPSFTDIQALFNYRINSKINIDFWATYNRNRYQFSPTDRESSFGTISNARRLKIYFDGNENDKYIANNTALKVKYQPNADTYLRLIANRYHTDEQEYFDILSQYYLSDLYVSQGGEINNELEHLGIGTSINHARNQLTQEVKNIQFKGDHHSHDWLLKWGVGIKWNHLNDKINEWQYQDSAGYTMPLSATHINMASVRNTKNKIKSRQIAVFAQGTKVFRMNKGELQLTGGLRYKHWNYNNQSIISPRFSIYYIPQWQHKMRFKLAAGIYQQMPEYREMLTINGNISNHLEAQKSIHYIIGHDYYFQLWNRPFKITSELYYKKLQSVIPYNMENVRIRYDTDKRAKGYAMGFDFRMNGEFVAGTESWVSFSLLKTEEDIIGDHQGYMPRASDQRFHFALCFQDYLPNNPSYKMYLMLIYGGKIPVWTPKYHQADNYFRMPHYRRLDLGFSKVFINKNHRSTGWLRSVKSLSVGIVFFNVLDIKNTVSYLWTKDYTGKQYATPNYLTGRKINVNLSIQF